MKIYALWYGGPNYAAPRTEDVESFPSLSEVRSELWRRSRSTYYPCTVEAEPDEGGHYFLTYRVDPREESDPMPDRIIRFGPRGGIVQERI